MVALIVCGLDYFMYSSGHKFFYYTVAVVQSAVRTVRYYRHMV